MNFLREHAYDLRHASSKKLQLLALRAGAQPEDVAEAMTEEVAVGDRTTKLLSLVMELGVHTLFTPERTPEREAMPSGVRYEPTMPTLSPHRTRLSPSSASSCLSPPCLCRLAGVFVSASQSRLA